MISILYDTERCLDGLKLVDGFFRPLSERREPVHVVTADLDDPVVLQFVNARDEDALVQFMSKYSAGNLYTGEEPPQTRVAHTLGATKLADMRDYLRRKLASAGSSDQVEALVALSEPRIETKATFHLRDGKAQMLLVVTTCQIHANGSGDDCRRGRKARHLRILRQLLRHRSSYLTSN